jgi:hypothetical protein
VPVIEFFSVVAGVATVATGTIVILSHYFKFMDRRKASRLKQLEERTLQLELETGLVFDENGFLKEGYDYTEYNLAQAQAAEAHLADTRQRNRRLELEQEGLHKLQIQAILDQEAKEQEHGVEKFGKATVIHPGEIIIPPNRPPSKSDALWIKKHKQWREEWHKRNPLW